MMTTPMVVKNTTRASKYLANNRRLANILFVWIAVVAANSSSSCQPMFSCGAWFRRAFANAVPNHPSYRYGPPSIPSAFVRPLGKIGNYNNIYYYHCQSAARTAAPFEPNHFGSCYKGKSHRSSSTSRTYVTLAAGRERRISSSSTTTTNKNSSSHEQNDPNSRYGREQQKLIQQEEAARQKRLDEMDRRIQKLVRREERILVLEAKLALVEGEPNGGTTTETNEVCMTDAERAELEGLRKVQSNFEEQYDPREFTEEHLEFKALHNEVFARLVRWCEEQQATEREAASKANVFFLDGPDGGTASSLIDREDFAPSQCYVANRHESTCRALRKSGGGLLPEENVVHATCSEALSKGTARQGAFAEMEFTGFYFDGCTGYAPHTVNMMSAALLVLRDDLENNRNENLKKETKVSGPIAVGYSLLGGTKNLVEKELEVSRAMTVIARSRGMRMVHALDDPVRFGLPENVPKLGGKRGTTFTTWLILEPEN